MRTLFGVALCVTCLAQPMPHVEVIVPASAAHPQDWLHPQIRDNPKPDYQGKRANNLAAFVAPEVISKIAVDQYAGPPDDVRRYLTAMPTAEAQYFGPSLLLCEPHPGTNGARLAWTSISTITFESGRSAKLAVATVVVANGGGLASKVSPDCFGLDKVPVDSLYARYVDPDGYSWYFAVPLHRKN